MLVVCACLFAAPAGVIAQVVRPEAADRVVGRFDFELDGDHLEPVPRHWVRLVDAPPEQRRPGFPAWNESGFDDSRAYEGRRSVVLPTNGGSAALRLVGGVLAVMPGADYAVSARVRTEGLTHARARMTVRLLDESLQPVPGTRTSTPLVQSPGAWRDVHVELRGDHPRAAWIQIDLELLQPEHYRSAPASEHDLRREDFSGAAWFDDVQVRQLPRIELATNSPVNFILAPERPTLTSRVLDLTGERLQARLLVRDVDGRLVDEHEFNASSRGAGVAWTPELDRFGWYNATLTILADDRRVASADLAFVYAPGAADASDMHRRAFGVVAREAPEERLQPAQTLIERIGAGRVNLPLWSAGAEPNPRRLDALDAVVTSMLDRRVGVTLTLNGRIRLGDADPADPLQLALEAPALLSERLDPALVRFGQRIRRWQVGVAGETSPTEQRDLAEKLDAVEYVLSRLSPEPIVSLPWPATREAGFDALESISLSLAVPSESPPDAVGEYLRFWRDAGALDALAVLERAPDDYATPRSRITDLAKRAVHARRLPDFPIAIADPWTWRGVSPSPSPEAAAWRTLIERLAGRSVVGELPTPDGVRALILSPVPGAAGSTPQGGLVAWRDWSDPTEAVLHGYFGAERLIVGDIFGNERILDADEDGAHHIPLTRTPIFVEGVDDRIAAFRGRFRVEPGFIESIAARHELDLVLHNPWPVPISGRLRVVEPERWAVSPRVQRFSAQPGEEIRLPIVATLGVGEEAGRHDVLVEMDLTADGAHPLFRVDAPIEVGLASVTMTATARRTDGGDIVVTVLVTNTSDRRVTMTASLAAPGAPRQQAPISALAPGASTARNFTLRAAADRLSGKRVRVGLEEAGGPLRLNKTISIP